jgi:hypothetical protein
MENYEFLQQDLVHPGASEEPFVATLAQDGPELGGALQTPHDDVLVNPYGYRVNQHSHQENLHVSDPYGRGSSAEMSSLNLAAKAAWKEHLNQHQIPTNPPTPSYIGQPHLHHGQDSLTQTFYATPALPGHVENHVGYHADFTHVPADVGHIHPPQVDHGHHQDQAEQWLHLGEGEEYYVGDEEEENGGKKRKFGRGRRKNRRKNDVDDDENVEEKSKVDARKVFLGLRILGAAHGIIT